MEEARKTAFENLVAEVAMNQRIAFDKDCLRGVSSKGKQMSFFGNLCIVSLPALKEINYYDLNGILQQVEHLNALSFPSIGHVYAYPTGKLTAVRYYASRDETYNFNPDGSLHSRWVGDTWYDAGGRVLQKRTDAAF